ncbi:MAG: hypothetical protein ABR543_09305, partial [Gemmatimonadaceae bacterium]
ALVGAWDARYPTFGIKDSAGMKVVAETGEQDSRYTYGLTLGLAPWFLDWRDTRHVALWPEVIINPSDDVKAIEFDMAATFYWLKLGAGLLWTRHPELTGGHEVGGLIGASDIRTRNTYSDSKYFMSFSIVGWPPFLRTEK